MNKHVEKFIKFLKEKDGIGNKLRLISLATNEFNLTRDRSVYYTEHFAVRFSHSRSGGFSNTILSLSQLQKFDSIPFIVCLVTSNENILFLANTTFLTKISHSSQTLTPQNIRGSFNGSDITKVFHEIENTHKNFGRLFPIHAELGFDGNLVRLVEATTNISPTGKKFNVGDAEKNNILDSIVRAEKFLLSPDYKDLKADLDNRVKKYENEILVASHIDNINLRGRIIEYLIADDADEKLKKNLVREIKEEYGNLPKFKTENQLGDYIKVFEKHYTATDIKTKIMLLNSNPKAYNIDKMLEFLSMDTSVFLFYFIGIDPEKILNKVLTSMFQKDILSATLLLKHWSGRNSRGVTQLEGTAIHNIIVKPNNEINKEFSTKFINDLIEL